MKTYYNKHIKDIELSNILTHMNVTELDAGYNEYIDIENGIHGFITEEKCIIVDYIENEYYKKYRNREIELEDYVKTLIQK